MLCRKVRRAPVCSGKKRPKTKNMECNYSPPTPCIYSELADIILQDNYDNYGFENAGGGHGAEQKCVTIPEISLVPDRHGRSLGSGNVVHSSLQGEHKRQKSMGCLSSSSGVLAPDSMDSGDTTGDNEPDGARRQKQQQKQKQKQRLSVDPQSIAARHRRHRISRKFKILQSMVPGGSKMDTASMLDEAIQYVKFLKMQIWLHDQLMPSLYSANGVAGAPYYCSSSRHGSAASEAFIQNAASIPYSSYNSTTVGLVHANPSAAEVGSIENFSEISYGSSVRDRYHA